MTSLSIIIISYNTKEITKKCLETITASLNYDPTIRTEIIVVDNNSSDRSVEMLKEVESPACAGRQKLKVGNKNAKFKIILNKENLGFAKGNNLAVKHAKGRCLLFLNSDIEVIKDAIPQMYNFFIQDKNPFNFLGGKLLNKDLSLQPSCGPFYSLSVVFAALFLRGDCWGLTRYSPDKTKEVNWVSGACFICKKEDFEKLNGFDEKIFMYMEEIDLFYRAKKQRMKIGFIPFAKFIHLGSASSQKRTQPILQVYRGFLYFYKKHHSVFKIKILKYMLKLKALIAVLIGRTFKNQYLTETYEKAFQIAKDS